MFQIGDTIKTNGIGRDVNKLVCCVIVEVISNNNACIVSKRGKYYAAKSLSSVKSSRVVLVEKTVNWFVIGQFEFNV